MRMATAALDGVLFGAGLVISGMADPMRVLGFFDVLGAWDPTLAFVMGGAAPVMAAAWALLGRMATPVFADAGPGAPGAAIDARLVGGAALFGLGWGLSGLCPGPAVAALGYGGAAAWVFFLALAAGLFAPAAPAWLARRMAASS